MKVRVIVICLLIFVGFWLCYEFGKSNADRYYAKQREPIDIPQPLSPQANAFELHQNDGPPVVSIAMDGKVTFGKGFSADSASKEFWNDVSKEWTLRCHEAEQAKGK